MNTAEPLERGAPSLALSGWLEQGIALARRHAFALAVLAAVVAVLALPRWWMVTTEPGEGVRVPLSPWGAGPLGYDEALYASSIRQAYEGQLPVSDPYLVGHAGDVADTNALPHYAVALTGRAVGGMFEGLAVASTLALVAALVLLYTLACRLTRSRVAAVASVLISLAAVQVFNEADGILPLRHMSVLKVVLQADPEREFHVWTRYPSPALSLAPFFLLALTMPRAVESASRGWMLAAGAALSLLAYVYFYYWTAAALAVALWFAWTLVERDFVSARRIALVGAVSVVLAAPELVVLVLNALELPADARDRVGLRDPGLDTAVRMVLLQRLALVAVLGALVWRGRGAAERFYMSIALAPLLLLPVQGVVPQTWHYKTQVWGVFVIPLAIAGVVAGWRMLSRGRAIAPRLGYAALAVAVAAAGAYFVVHQSRALAQVDGAFAVRADEKAALDWIAAELSHDDTVASTSITTNLLLAGLTPSSQYISEGSFSTASDDELIDRQLRLHAAFGITEAQLLRRFQIDDPSAGFPVNDREGSLAELEERLERFMAFYLFNFEIEDVDEFTARVATWPPVYERLLEEEAVLSAHDVDYIYCGPRERMLETRAPAPGTFVRAAFERGDVTVYAITDAEGGTEFAGC
ncbi:MAG TPA: hypothetical protein VNM91_01570 [Dehalococcoidia bacterium]|nr:hypothetical protein [Dehalococcoidia bacterium]